MNAPQRHQRSVDDDPTGMRALLRGLPDPGPMPDDLVARIQSSLAAQPPLETQAVDLGAYRTQRAARKGVWIAAAASLLAVAGGGVLASGGPSAMVAAFTGGSSAGSAASTAESAQRDAVGAPVSGMIPAGTVHVIMTNAAWTGTDLTPAAHEALTSTGDQVREFASESPAIGPIGTAVGGRDCATELGVPSDASVLIDLGTHDGQPAALVVATTTHGEQTAYLVGRNCRTGNSELRIGPQPIRL